MNVNELIKELQKYPKDTMVAVTDSEWWANIEKVSQFDHTIGIFIKPQTFIFEEEND